MFISDDQSKLAFQFLVAAAIFDLHMPLCRKAEGKDTADVILP